MSVVKVNYLGKRISTILPLGIRSLSSKASSQNNYISHQLDLFLSNQVSDTQSLFQSHAFIITSGHSNNIFLAAKLISFYSFFNRIDFSKQVFYSVHPKDTFLWNSIIKSHFSNGEYSRALKFYDEMCNSSTPPTHFTIPMVVAACAELLALDHGKNIHGITLKLGLFYDNSAAGSSFVYMYSKCGEMGDASRMFDEIPFRDVISWTALVIGYVQNDENEKALGCVHEMHSSGTDEEKPNSRTIEGALQASGNLGALLEVKDLISWTTIIGVYAKTRNIHECLDLFCEMLAAEIEPDWTIISCMLSRLGNSMRINEGKAFHGLVIRRNFTMNQMIINSLLAMYCKFGCMHLAGKLFHKFCGQDEESWNWMVFGYGKVGMEAKSLELFRKMHHLDLNYDLNSLVSVICSCSNLVATHLGQSLHCYVIKIGISENVSIANSLMGMYGKCNDMTMAWMIFSWMHRDVVTWNILISAYVHNGYCYEALILFDQMVSENMKPNSVTLVIVLSACAHLANLELGEKVHCYIKERGLECDLCLSTALVDMYVKCGQLGIAREIFTSLDKRDVISWNVMISGYGIHGDAKSAIEIFQQMEESGERPNALTFLSVLSACNHAGLIEEGKYLFGKMKEYCVSPTLKHYSCMVDLLGRSGNLREAEAMVLSMPIAPDGGVWGALLGACRMHNDVEMGERVAKWAIESDPGNDGYYVLLSNMYNSIGRWKDAEKVREMIKKNGVRKIAGWSVI
uniref:Pentatricopeptide repeat-containing protein At4g39952, mitochondrial n=1 Tax=Nelumbo nucifera TaxID=4432 RepID=A0A822XNH5_NELNU|nr:TPA_asm: hypothetical protein HUJ06_023423 [Nelumbo nucifera]